jgi:hypothetical protein
MVPPWTCHGTIEPFATLPEKPAGCPKLPVSSSRNINTSNGKAQPIPGNAIADETGFWASRCEAWVKEDKPLDPLPIRRLRADRIMLAHYLADLIQQLELRIRNEPLTRSGRLCISNIEPHLL